MAGPVNEDAAGMFIGRRCEAVMPVPELGIITLFFEGGISLMFKVENGKIRWEIEEGEIH